MPDRAPHIVIVGASLAGLMAALALATRGATVEMLERSDDRDRTGAALQVGHGLIGRLTGRRRAGPDLSGGLQTWQAVHAALRAAADADPAITVHQRTAAAAAGQDGAAAWVATADGRRVTGDAVIGADGYRSIVRRAVSPERPDAVFAGYLAWVGFTDEGAITAPYPRDLAFLERGPYTMLGFPLPARGHGPRQIGWAWYDAGRNALLHDSGAVTDGRVNHSLRPGDMPDSAFADLAADARRRWPRPWLDAMLDCLDRRAIIGTPVAEYLPDRLARGRLALVGDAAHVATPMTGNGFPAAATDALSLADALATTDDIATGLAAYEAARLTDVRALVLSGQRFSRQFVAG
ncbi:MAG: FAD-dependent monooxygenase [Sphingomonas fennica]